jgi:hypothetical protein
MSLCLSLSPLSQQSQAGFKKPVAQLSSSSSSLFVTSSRPGFVSIFNTSKLHKKKISAFRFTMAFWG